MSGTWRHYEKRDYEGTNSSLGCGLAFLGVGILSLVLSSLSIDFLSLNTWGHWLLVPAFFMIIGAINNKSTDKRVRRDVLAVVQARKAGRFLLDEIAADAGVKRSHLLRVLMDLRGEGLVSYKYDSQTGEIILGEEVQYQQAPGFEPARKGEAPVPQAGSERKYCIFCGQMLDANPQVKFCPNCGSQLP
ncbi:MAG: hypothetical protein JW839_08025 [Candidatus Lokiarchaeota archaeon]|nr:hypothetical protein [Candidatus Lokiarchaeota archaeon]